MTRHPRVIEAVRRLDVAGVLGDVDELHVVRLDGAEVVVVPVPITSPAGTHRRVTAALRGLPHECILGYPARGSDGTQTVTRDGRTYRVATALDVAWIRGRTTSGPAITTAIPPVFEAYATVAIPEGDDDRPAADTALLRRLTDATPPQPWLLGYLDTGAHDVVFDDVSMVELYWQWAYVLVEAGPDEAGTWRDDDAWRGRLPDLIFPADRSWLVSMLWDDDWRCIGGGEALIEALLVDSALEVRQVRTDEDATPPGDSAI